MTEQELDKRIEQLERDNKKLVEWARTYHEHELEQLELEVNYFTPVESE